jgi:hypothetical protein
MASEWYFTRGGDREGPVNSRQLKALVKSGEIQPDTLVWKQGMRDWTAASSIPGLCTEAGVSDGPPTEPSSPTERDTGASNGRRLPLADRILRTGFAIGRWLSIAVVVVAIVVIAFGSVSYSASLVPVPSVAEPEATRPTAGVFVTRCVEEHRSSQNERAAGNRRDTAGPPLGTTPRRGGDIEVRDECAAYRLRIRDILAYLQLDNTGGDNEAILCRKIAELPEDDREWFAGTFVEFAKEWRATDEADRLLCRGADAANWFIAAAEDALAERRQRFMQLQLQQEAEEAARLRRRSLAVQMLAGGLGGLLVFLIIPLLIQIERNTRVTTES